MMNKQLEKNIAGYQWEITPEILDELINMVLARPLSWRELAVQYLELNGLAVDWTPLKEAILERMSAQVHEYDDTVLEAVLAQNDSMHFWSYMSKHLWAEIEMFHDAMVWASRHGYRADFLSERLVNLGWMRTLIRQIKVVPNIKTALGLN